MAIVRESPRFYNSTSTDGINTASSGANRQFGFLASYVRIENLGTRDLWVRFNSTGAASTEHVLIRACESSRVLELNFGRPAGPAMVSVAGCDTGTASGVSIFAYGEP